MSESTETRFYQSAVGFPYAIKGKKIAGYFGIEGKKRIFYVTTITRFEKEKFSVSKLREVNNMPSEFKKGLEKLLKKS